MRVADALPVARKRLLVAAAIVLVAACSSGGGAANPSTGYGAPLSNSTAPAGRAGGASAAPRPGSASRAASSAAEVTIRVTTMMQLGSFLTDAAGRTLYVFRKDGPHASACTEGCATAWPPLTVEPGQTVSADPAIGARISIFARPDGTTQVAFDQAPLYYFSGDSAAGDTNGQGMDGVWFVSAIARAGAARSAPPSAAEARPAGSAPASGPAGGYGGS